MIISEPLLEFDYEGTGDMDRYLRRLNALLRTVSGTCPGARDFGLSGEFQDTPPAVAQTAYSVEVYEKVEKYIPEVEILEITFVWDDSTMRPRIVLGINEDYDEEDQEEEEW